MSYRIWQGTWMEHSISANTWYSVVFIFSNSGNMELYVNGVSVATSAGGTAVRTHSGSIGIGGMINSTKFHDIGDAPGNGNYFSGSIDDLGIWNRALTSTEAAQLNSRSVIDNNSGTVVTGGLSRKDGSFNIKEIPLGQYIIIIEFIGYAKKEIGPLNIFPGEDGSINNFLGEISLKISSVNLDAVDVVAVAVGHVVVVVVVVGS